MLCIIDEGEQVITVQKAQQLKTNNINAVPGRLFYRQCKAKFLLEILTMNSLNAKHQGKSSNQLETLKRPKNLVFGLLFLSSHI